MHSIINWVKCGSNTVKWASNTVLINSKSLFLLPSMSLSSTSYHVKNINIRIPGSLYNKLKKTNKLYRNSPDDGIEVNVEYADTDDANSKKGVIVALHGIFGCRQNFNKLIEFLAPNYRVLVPNFPTLQLTRETGVYWHSSEEKSQFIKEFLSALDVHRVDCLICHSGGTFPGSFLWSEPTDQLVIKSVALFNMISPQRLPFITKFFIKKFAKLTKNYGVEPVLKLRLDFIGSLFGFTTDNSFENLLEQSLALTCDALRSLDERIKYLYDNKIPTLYLMVEKDPFYSAESYLDAIKVLNVNDNNFSIFDGNKDNINLISSASQTDLLHVINIRPGGHYAFSKYAHVVNPILENFIINNKRIL